MKILNYGHDIDFEDAVDLLIDMAVVTEKELNLVMEINGYNKESLNDILYARTGYRTFEQYVDVLENE